MEGLLVGFIWSDIMSLGKCSDCGGDLSDTVGYCPHCDSTKALRDKNLDFQIKFFIILGIVTVCVVYGLYRLYVTP